MVGGSVDVAIIGCGPAGATAANVLATKGLGVLVLEREVFPRFRVGESFLPYSNPVLKRLGVWSQLVGAGAVVKRGATFENSDGSRRARVDFSILGDEALATSFHLERSSFDQLLLERAEAAGAQVLQGARVDACDPSSAGCQLTWQQGDQKHEIHARFVLDASGRAGVLARKLGGVTMDAAFKKTAIFAHYKGGLHLSGSAAGDIRIVMSGHDGWGWQIPLREGRSSVGFVFDARSRGRRKGESKEELLQRLVCETPTLAAALDGAQRTSEVRSASDYSYRCRKMAGPGWALIGDACGFLDPVFSTGVHFALVHGVEVADALLRGWRGGAVLDEALFQSTSNRQQERYERYRKFVAGFYQLGQRELLLEPESWPEGAEVVTRVLAGSEEFGMRDRCRIQAFHLLGLLRTPRT